MKFKLTCSKDALYGARRNELISQKQNEITYLLDKMSNWSNWDNKILLDDEHRFNGCYVMHIPIIKTIFHLLSR